METNDAAADATMPNEDNQGEKPQLETMKVADMVRNRLKWCSLPHRVPRGFVAQHENASIVNNASGMFLCIPLVEERDYMMNEKKLCQYCGTKEVSVRYLVNNSFQSRPSPSFDINSCYLQCNPHKMCPPEIDYWLGRWLTYLPVVLPTSHNSSQNCRQFIAYSSWYKIHGSVTCCKLDLPHTCKMWQLTQS